MSASAIAVDAFALLAIAVGFAMVFRQDQLRRLWRGPETGSAQAESEPAPSSEDDPAHYALSIFGMMLLAFGLTIFGFVTFYALLT